MPTMHILIGLPASGKSTKADELLEGRSDIVRLNKDSIRELLFCIPKNHTGGKAWNRSRESIVVEIEQELARKFLGDGLDIIIDDTNLNDRYVETWKALAKEDHHKFVVHDFRDVPIEECVERDACREKSVGRAVIYKLAALNDIIKSQNRKVDFGDKRYIVTDIDGTLANIDHRTHFLDEGSWDGFFAAMGEDIPNDYVVGMLNDVYPDHPVVIVTGRPEEYRVMTEEWLAEWEIRYDVLLMRHAHDRRPDPVVKQEIIDQFLNREMIDMWIDDRPVVIMTVRANGIPVTDVGKA